MATQSLPTQDQQSTIQTLVRTWDRRLRLQQFVRWAGLSFIPALVLGLVMAVISRLRPWLLSEQILTITLITLGGSFVAFVLGIVLYPRSIQRAAQKFDLMFRLNERVSTALELLNGTIRSDVTFTEHQLADTVQQAQAVRAADHLPLKARWGDWATVIVLGAIVATLLMLPNPMEDQVVAAPEENPAVEEAADVLRDITEEVAADSALSEEERLDLLEELDQSIETLDRDDITTEEAFAELSEVESELQQQADSLSEQLSQQMSALASAREALDGAFPESDQAENSELSDSEALSDRLEAMENLGEEADQQSMADALQEAAEALQQSNPEAAQALQDAAQAFQDGDQQALSDALNEAQESLDSQQQQMDAQQSTQQNLQQGANQASEAQQNLQQGQQQDGEMQEGQEGQSGDQQDSQQQNGDGQQAQQFEIGTPQPGQQSNGQMGQPGDQPNNEQQNGQQQSGQGQTGQPGDQQGQPGQLQQGQPGQQPGSMAGNPNTGAGDQESNGATSGFQGNSDPIDTNNNPDGEGEEEFEAIYAPQRIGGDGGPSISLESEDGSSPLVEGDFSENPTGTSSVPYNEVFSDYSDAASQALESDYIPLGMQDVVREYFTSIEPGQ